MSDFYIILQAWLNHIYISIDKNDLDSELAAQRMAIVLLQTQCSHRCITFVYYCCSQLHSKEVRAAGTIICQIVLLTFVQRCSMYEQLCTLAMKLMILVGTD